MASETEVKSRRGMLGSMKRAEDTRAFLSEFDPEDSTVVALRRMALGLNAALARTLEDMFHASSAIQRTEAPPAQMVIADLITTARKASPSLRDDELEAIADAANGEDDDQDGEPDAEAPEPDAYPEAVSAEELLDLLEEHQPNRWTLEALLRTTDAEREVAARWCREGATKGESPPAAIARTILEDLDLADEDDLVELLGWLGIRFRPPKTWHSDELREQVVEWARAKHRVERGAEDIEVPELPLVLTPPSDAARVALETIGSYTKGCTTSEVAQRVDTPALIYVLKALAALGLVAYYPDEDRWLVPGKVDFELLAARDREVAGAIANIGAGRKPMDGLVPEASDDEDAEADEFEDADGEEFGEEE